MSMLAVSTKDHIATTETFKIWCEYNFTKEEVAYDLDGWFVDEDNRAMTFECEEDAVFVADILTKQAQSFHGDKSSKPTYTVKQV